MKQQQKKQEELDQQLTNMLIHMYNGKNPKDYVKEYKCIIDIVSFMYLTIWQLTWQKKTFGLNAENLMTLFRNKISDIVGQVRDKLNKDCKDYKLINTIMKEAVLDPTKPLAKQPQATAAASGHQ